MNEEIAPSIRRDSDRGYEHGLHWENLAYGIGTLAIIAGPPLIPGVEFKGWGVTLIGLVLALYFAVCVVGAWRSLRGPRVKGVAGRGQPL